MNSKLKTFMMTLVLIPCIFIFAGCNPAQLDQKIKLDTRGRYAETTGSTAKEALENSNILDVYASGILNFKSSLDITLTLNNQSMQFSMTFFTTTKLINTTQTKFEQALRIRGTVTDESNITTSYLISMYTISITDSEDDNNDSLENYIEYSITEANNPAETGKYKIVDQGIEELENIASIPAGTLFEILDQYMPSAPDDDSWDELWANDDVTYAVASNSRTTKVRITTPEVKDGNTIITPTSNLYYVIENNEFVGLQTDKITLNLPDFLITADLSLAVFDGTIDMPDFSEYVVYSDD